MRWYILRTLLHKELLRHLANRGGLALALLLIVASMLLSIFSKRQTLQTSQLVGGVVFCFVDYGEASPWVEHLRNNIAPELRNRIRFRNKIYADYPGGAGAIQIWPNKSANEPLSHRRQASRQSGGHAPYENWLWRETRRYFSSQAAEVLGRDRLPAKLFTGDPPPAEDSEDLWAYNEAHRQFRDELHQAWEARNGNAALAARYPDSPC